MEDLIQEIRSDIKTILVNQARMEERTKHHTEEMHEAKDRIDIIEKKIQPIAHVKWLLGGLVVLIPSCLAILKFIGV
jgi:predicted nuclease with TOPRIM domain